MSRSYRIGQIVPSSNTTMETEIPAMFRAREGIRPERFTFHGSRMRMHKVTREELEAMNREGLRCAAELADARVDVMSTACLVAIMAMGNGYQRDTERELAEVARANGCSAPVMTSQAPSSTAFASWAARKIVLLAPYMRPLCDLVVGYIENEGIKVINSIAFEVSDNRKVGLLDPARLVEEVKKLDTAQADVIVLSACVQMPSLPSIQIVEDRLGIPVTSTAICTTRLMLDHLQVGAGRAKCGRAAFREILREISEGRNVAAGGHRD